ncbi:MULTISPECIES: hypothetical protein [Rheinheimera]|jgi:hypothetical protein|uniref:Porin family protein n=1 Tax=Rheinheimera tangshanensis TaxID=400153 RepID=A0A5C8LPY6_9GAMM|nr:MULTISPECIES: hypothetical protein [Rheinheimera]KOO57660.1 hypothetical protein WH43_13200 [Rheinheimera sp. KL1]TXK78023.1 hypothetical protein FU839_17215 [Rheinheimera tangshanensis]GGM70834.1 hypothetical protein GCM10010920_34470 [Rheinheimera tangshanensis]
MKMKVALTALVLTAAFTATVQAGEFIPAAGFGSQYGDLGGKFIYRENNMALYVGVGVNGAAVGFHLAPSVSSQHVFGAQYASESDVFDADSLLLATYDYHFNGFNGRGWTLGGGLGTAEHQNGRREGDNKTVAVLNVGYKF